MQVPGNNTEWRAKRYWQKHEVAVATIDKTRRSGMPVIILFLSCPAQRRFIF